MNIRIEPVCSARDLETFVRFPWHIYPGDPYWVPPLLDARRERLDTHKNPFWKTVTRELWIAWRGQEAVGTVAAFLPLEPTPERLGYFGFFEAIREVEVARLLLSTAEAWLGAHGVKLLRGPYNPSLNDETGVLVEGFQTRAAIMQGHNPDYYPEFFERGGYERYADMLARLVQLPALSQSVEECLPPRLYAVAARASQRPDLRIRPLRPGAWEDEMRLACALYNASLVRVEGFVPIPLDEFMSVAEGFRPILSPDMALIAELKGKAVGYVLALPDVNEALQPLNGRLNPLNMLRLWFGTRHLKRACLKILVILPEFQGRGVEAVLIYELTKAILKHGYAEVDMSLAGDDNPQSTLFQEHLGFKVYRRYRVYQKEILHDPE
jgi:GNAT superfamily N-acetyltransferase